MREIPSYLVFILGVNCSCTSPKLIFFQKELKSYYNKKEKYENTTFNKNTFNNFVLRAV